MSRILLIGKTGQVGHELERTLQPLGELIAPDRNTLDLTNPDSIRRIIRESRPDAIVNAAGFTIVDDAESQPELAMQLNGTAPGIIAECAARSGALLIHFSTTFVFDGSKREPYTENDAPNPLNAYGRSKLAGENAVMSACSRHLILRANWVYSERRSNFVLAILKLARRDRELTIVDDQYGSPTWAGDYAEATARLLRTPERVSDNPGIYHLSARSSCSRMQWARKIIDTAKTVRGDIPWASLRPTTSALYPHPAPRPLYTITSNRKMEQTFGINLPAWDDRVDEFVRTLLSQDKTALQNSNLKDPAT